MTDPVAWLRRDYVPVFLKYLTRQDEAGLEAAYTLGREAMRRSIGLLDVVRVHNEVYLDVVATVRDVAEAQQVAQSASAFLVELIAAFEMVQRGFMEGRLRDSAPHRPPSAG